MQANALVTRTRDAGDERVVRIHLTERGHALREQTADVPSCVARAIGLGRDELASLSKTSDDLRDRLISMPDDPADNR